MNAVEEAWRRSELETLACEYHGIFDDAKKRFAKYSRIIKFKLDLLKYLKRRLAAEKSPSSAACSEYGTSLGLPLRCRHTRSHAT